MNLFNRSHCKSSARKTAHGAGLWLVVAAVFSLLPVSRSVMADDATAEPAKAGRYWIQARLRNENVDQDNTRENATAMTLRNRLGYETKNYQGFQFLIEGENIFALRDDYNSTTNGNTQYSVVADPEDSEINRVFLSYSGLEKTTVAIGRQKIILDNARFVGNVGWRQNEQTFDSLTVVNSSIANTIVKFAYIDKVRRIFGPDSPKGETDMSSPIVNVTYRGFENIALTVYGYFLDFDDLPLNSQQTIGFRLLGAHKLGSFNLKYGFEVADQQDYKGGSAVIDADYFHATLNAIFSDINVGVGYESLGGDGSYGFQTPLATAHAFNGWADLFLATPAVGLTDKYLSLGGKLKGVQLKAVYHRFQADFGSQDFGSEFDMVASRKFGDHFSAGVKYARYSADQRGVDTQKLWVFGQLNL